MISKKLAPTKPRIEQGDVVLVDFPFSHHRQSKHRPALVISSRHYHILYPDIILLPITSRLNHQKQNFDYPLKGYRCYGLLRPSLIKMVIGTFDPGLILGRIGKISEREFREIRRCLTKVFGTP